MNFIRIKYSQLSDKVASNCHAVARERAGDDESGSATASSEHAPVQRRKQRGVCMRMASRHTTKWCNCRRSGDRGRRARAAAAEPVGRVGRIDARRGVGHRAHDGHKHAREEEPRDPREPDETPRSVTDVSTIVTARPRRRAPEEIPTLRAAAHVPRRNQEGDGRQNKEGDGPQPPRRGRFPTPLPSPVRDAG